MSDPFLISIWDHFPKEHQRSTKGDFLYVLADTLRMPKIQKYRSTWVDLLIAIQGFLYGTMSQKFIDVIAQN